MTAPYPDTDRLRRVAEELDPDRREFLWRVAEELDAAREALRDFEHVEGEPLADMADVAVQAYAFSQHSGAHWRELAEERERASRPVPNWWQAAIAFFLFFAIVFCFLIGGIELASG